MSNKPPDHPERSGTAGAAESKGAGSRGPHSKPAPLDDDARAALLERAIRIEARSLAQYLARNAPPVDLAKRPEVARALESIARAEEDGVRELTSRIEEIGGTPGRTGGYDPSFMKFNYIASAHALDVLARRLAEATVALEALAKDAGEDIWVAPAVAEAIARKREHAAIVADLRAKLAAPARAASPAPPFGTKPA